MAQSEFKITNDETGVELIFKSETGAPPTREQVLEGFANEKAQKSEQPKDATVVDYALEGIAGFNRPMAALLDVAISPISVAAEMLGMPFESFSERVGPKGQFAGDSFMTDVVSATGEVASIAVPFGVTMRAGGEVLSQLNRMKNPSMFRETLARIGDMVTKTNPAMDLQYGAAAGAFGEIAAAGSGEIGEVIAGDTGRIYGEETGRIVGQTVAPVAVASMLNRSRNLLTTFVQKTLNQNVKPSELKGASDILYEDLKKMGIYYSDESLEGLANNLNEVAVKEGIFGLGADGGLTPRLKGLLSTITATGDNYGTTFSYMHAAVKEFKGLANSTTLDKNIQRQARAIANRLETFMTSEAEVAGMGRTLRPSSNTQPSTSLRTVQPGESLPIEAQPLGQQVGRQRSQTGEALEGDFSVSFETNAGVPLEGITQAELGETIIKNYKSAGDLWRRGSVLEDLNLIAANAKVETDSIFTSGNAVKQQVRELIKIRTNPSEFNRLSNLEQKALNEAISSRGQGKKFFTALESLGLSSTDAVKWRFLNLAPYVAATTAGTTGAASIPVLAGSVLAAETISQMASRRAIAIVRNDINYLRAVTAAGNNGEQIVSIYLQKTPRSEWLAEDLASLLINGEVYAADIAAGKFAGNKLVETAAAMVGIASAEISNQTQQQ